MTALKYAEELLSPVTEEHEAEARIIISELTVPVYDVVNRPVVVTLKYVDI